MDYERSILHISFTPVGCRENTLAKNACERNVFDVVHYRLYRIIPTLVKYFSLIRSKCYDALAE